MTPKKEGKCNWLRRNSRIERLTCRCNGERAENDSDTLEATQYLIEEEELAVDIREAKGFVELPTFHSEIVQLPRSNC